MSSEKIVVTDILYTVLLIGYLAYFTNIDNKKIINNDHNIHFSEKKDNLIVGSILGLDGSVLAETIVGEDAK